MKSTMLLAALMIAASINLTYSQSSPPSKVNFITEPGFDYGFLAWNNDWDSTVTFKAEVFKKIPDNNSFVYRSVFSQRQEKNFLRLDKQYISAIDYSYSVTVYDESSNIVATSDTLNANPYVLECECGPTLYEECGWICNGKTYAWRIGLYTDLNGGSQGVLQPRQAMAYENEELQMGVPLFEAMSDSAYQFRTENGPSEWQQFYIEDTDNRDFYKLENVTAGDNVVNSNGQNLTGTVYLVEKFMNAFHTAPVTDFSEQYSLVSGHATDLSSEFSLSTCGVWDLDHAIIRYNDTANHQYTSLPEYITPSNDTLNMQLECIPSFELVVPDGLIEHEIEANYPILGYWVECENWQTVFGTTTTWTEGYHPEVNFASLGALIDHQGFDCLDGINIGVGDGGGSGDGGSGGGGDSPNIVSVQAHKISEKGVPPVDIDLSHVFNIDDEPYVAPDYGFTSGLYKVYFIHDNGFAVPLVVEHRAEEYEPVTNSDLAELTVAPNPIESEFLEFKVEVEKRMNVRIKVLALDGTDLFSESRQLEAGSELKRAIKIPEQDYPYQQIVVKLLFDDDSSIEEIALRPEQ